MRALVLVVVLAGWGDVAGSNCARSFCGCWEAATLVPDGQVTDGAGQPASGITVTCVGETAPIATTTADGRFHAELPTRQSPGCGFERCNNVVFVDPSGMRPTTTLTHVQVNSGAVRMTPADGGP